MSINFSKAGKTILTLRWQPDKDLLAIAVSWVLVVAALYSATFLVGSTVAGGMAYFGLYAGSNSIRNWHSIVLDSCRQEETHLGPGIDARSPRVEHCSATRFCRAAIYRRLSRRANAIPGKPPAVNRTGAGDWFLRSHFLARLGIAPARRMFWSDTSHCDRLCSLRCLSHRVRYAVE